jgi:ATP phosphoribosyltransferase
MRRSERLRVALPHGGRLQRPTLDFLASSGFNVPDPGDRRYEIALADHPLTLLFQHARDIPENVRAGRADVGITGLDLYEEARTDNDVITLVHPGLGYGICRLSIAVPVGWLDVTNMSDIAEIAFERKEGRLRDANEVSVEEPGDGDAEGFEDTGVEGRLFRVATEFPRLTQRFLEERKVYFFRTVPAHGALELAPRMRSADIICDIVESGTTLEENNLKELDDGIVLRSQACLIANEVKLAENGKKLAILKDLLESIEGYLRAKQYVSITANLTREGGNEIPGLREEIGQVLSRYGLTQDNVKPERFVAIKMQAVLNMAGAPANHDLLGMTGPTVGRVVNLADPKEEMYSVTVVVPAARKARAIDVLRRSGGSAILVQTLDYIFEPESERFDSLCNALDLRRGSTLSGVPRAAG